MIGIQIHLTVRMKKENLCPHPVKDRGKRRSQLKRNRLGEEIAIPATMKQMKAAMTMLGGYFFLDFRNDFLGSNQDS